MLKNHCPITPAIIEYVKDNGVQEVPAAKILRELTAEMPTYMMQTFPEQAQFLAWLVKTLEVKQVLEVGTFTGYSALHMAMSLPEDGHLIACDMSEEWTKIALDFWGRAKIAHKITLKLGDATQTLQILLQEKGEGFFDFAFIDADKIHYDNYYELCLQLVRQGGTLVIDNTLFKGLVTDETCQEPAVRAIRALNAKIKDDERVYPVMLPMADGITLIRKS